MFKIQTLNAISSVGLNQFPRQIYEVASDLTHPDAIIVRSADMHQLIIPDTVRVVGRAGAGVNNIPVAALTERGIPVFNSPGANANAVRELVLAGMLLASRNICAAWQYVRDLSLAHEALELDIEKNKKNFSGFELMGKTLGLVGLGSIGVKVANAAVSLGMRVLGYDPTISVNRAWELSAEVKQAHSVDDLLIESDFISFHVPLLATTKNMIHRDRFRFMKQGVVLLNFARDGIIDNEALLEALNEKKVGCYVTDFPLAELKNHPRVIALPHLGASTREAEENCAVMVVNQVRKFLEDGAISFSVNFPSIELSPITSGIRLAIVNANVPNMVAQISAKLANKGLNITSLANQSKDNIAYTVIDLAADGDRESFDDIGNIPGVKQWRVLYPLNLKE